MKVRIRTLLLLVAVVAALLGLGIWLWPDSHFHGTYFKLAWPWSGELACTIEGFSPCLMVVTRLHF